MEKLRRPGCLLAGCLQVLFASTAHSDHAWNDYHWATTSKPIALQVVDSVTEDWGNQLVEAISQWSQSIVLSPVITDDDEKMKTRKDCVMINGKLHICNARYGSTGWLGQTVIGFDANGHIDKARIRLNDSYAQQWNLEKKNHVMCHEMGHVFGLAHTSQDGSSQQSCMDLAYNDPMSQWPNQHDFVQLMQIYAHMDSYNSYDDGSGLIADVSALSDPIKGKRVSNGPKYEIWLAPREDGGFWIHHILLATE
ncbi:matrixin family metalloprotease [Kaarinaea lacus]